MNVMEQKYLAFKKIHKDFSNIMKVNRCRTCACLYLDMMGAIYEKIRSFRKTDKEDKLLYIEKDFERWLKEAAELDLHG